MAFARVMMLVKRLLSLCCCAGDCLWPGESWCDKSCAVRGSCSSLVGLSPCGCDTVCVCFWCVTGYACGATCVVAACTPGPPPAQSCAGPTLVSEAQKEAARQFLSGPPAAARHRATQLQRARAAGFFALTRTWRQNSTVLPASCAAASAHLCPLVSAGLLVVLVLVVVWASLHSKTMHKSKK